MTSESDPIRAAFRASKAARYKDVKKKTSDPEVFEIDFSGFHETRAGVLPSIWVSTLREDTLGDEVVKRSRVTLWPEHLMYMDADEEELAFSRETMPLDFGAQYYREGMRYQAPEEYNLRIEAFEAARSFIAGRLQRAASRPW